MGSGYCTFASLDVLSIARTIRLSLRQTLCPFNLIACATGNFDPTGVY